MMKCSRGAITLLIVFLLALLLLASTQGLRKSLIFSDIFYEWKNCLQEYYAAEWLFDTGIEMIKDNFDSVVEQVALRGSVEIQILLAENSLLKSMLHQSDTISLRVKKGLNDALSSNLSLHISLYLCSKNTMVTIASCLLMKVDIHEKREKTSFLVNYYTIGAVL